VDHPSSPGWPAGRRAIGIEPFDGDGPRWVVARAEAELADRYGSVADSERGLTASMFEAPAGAFLVARTGGGAPPVGGVGLRGLAGATAEVKRLWVDPAARGQGVGRALMGELEGTARQLGFTTLRLGTGYRQREAVALYAGSGWEGQRLDWEGRPIPVGWILFAKGLA
jgi:GNAT superfamily N-acetyltransferase